MISEETGSGSKGPRRLTQGGSIKEHGALAPLVQLEDARDEGNGERDVQQSLLVLACSSCRYCRTFADPKAPRQWLPEGQERDKSLSARSPS